MRSLIKDIVAVSTTWQLIIVGLSGCQTQTTAAPPAQTFDTIINGIAFVKIPPGQFCSGIRAEKKNIPYTYYMAKYEITNQQYITYLKQQQAFGYLTVSGNKIYKDLQGIASLPDSTYIIKELNSAIAYNGTTFILNPALANHPVVQINWLGCTDFCRYYGMRLPTRNEWEKAARGMLKTDFPWGNHIDKTYANYKGSNDPYEPGTTPVGFYNGTTYGNFTTHNAASPYGCYDMSGNAWEYLQEYITDQGAGGAGGGFNYHTPAFLTVYNINCFGIEKPGTTLERCDTTDGLRPVITYDK